MGMAQALVRGLVRVRGQARALAARMATQAAGERMTA